MKLIGMLDSPYVRRVAICMKMLGLQFEHAPISVFSTYDQFAAINPVVKAPTLVADNGKTVMDSTVILQYLASLAGPKQRLFPSHPDDCLRAARLTGLSLAACDKSVQIVYERNLRPAEKQHEPWMDRVRAQVLAAYAELEQEAAAAPLPTEAERFGAAEVTVAGRVEFHADDAAADRQRERASAFAGVFGGGGTVAGFREYASGVSARRRR